MDRRSLLRMPLFAMATLSLFCYTNRRGIMKRLLLIVMVFSSTFFAVYGFPKESECANCTIDYCYKDSDCLSRDCICRFKEGRKAGFCDYDWDEIMK